MYMCVKNSILLRENSSKWLFSTHIYRSLTKKILYASLREKLVTGYFIVGERPWEV